MAPSSYQAPKRGDKQEKATYSQTTSSNLSTSKTTVASILEKKGDNVYTVTPDGTIADAVMMLKEKRIGALMVTNADGSIAGILSERDVVRKLAETPGATLPQKVSDLMTSDVVTCTRDDTLIETLKRMTEGKFRHLPVVSDGKLAGIITIGDAVNHRLQELEYEALKMKQMIVG